VEYRILGSLEVVANGTVADLGPPKQRAVLAVLLLHANEIVPTERLIDLVWPERPPRTAVHSVQIYVSELRKAIEPLAGCAPLATRPPGYVLEADPESIDAGRFTRLVEDGLRRLGDGDPGGSVTVLRSALALWGGSPLSDFTYEEFAQPHIRRLSELRLAALEELAATELDLGRAVQALPLIESAVAMDALRERSRELHMVALYRSGRHPEALRTYQRYRRLLADELGLEPSPPLRRLEERILLHDRSLDPRAPAPAAQAVARNPYKGLLAFEEEDAADFFGRKRLVGRLIAALAGSARLLALVGPSGSGKSSVVAAGLIPAIRAGAVPGSERWVVASMQPGRHPSLALEAALRRGTSDPPDGPAGAFHDDDPAVVGAAVESLVAGRRLLLVIDQFEQLFSATGAAERGRFLRTIASLVSGTADAVRVVLTLRGDFYDRPLVHAEFGRVFASGVVSVLPMTPDELGAAVVGPAERVGVEVEPTLLAELVSDAAAQPGALPLLEYALTDLFERRAGSSLSLEEYQAMGGLPGLLSRRSEEIYTRLDADHREVALQVFLRTARLGSGTRELGRPATMGELIALDLDPVLLSEVLDEFGRHRLLSFDRDPVSGEATVGVAHEALLTEWGRLAGWIDRHRADLRRHQTLSTAIDEWEAAGQHPDYLLAGSRLGEYGAWRLASTLRLTAREREFMDASRERQHAEQAEEMVRRAGHRRLKRRARTRLLALLVVVVMLAGAVTYGALAWRANRPSDAVLLMDRGPGPIREMVAAGFDGAISDKGIRGRAVTSIGSAVQSGDVRRFSERGTRMVVVVTPNCADAVEPIASTHPDTHYVVFDCVGDQPNVAYVSFASEQGSFLAGAAAALRTTTGTIGFIGGADIPLIWPFEAGFEAGARAVDPSIRIRARYLSEPPDMTGFDNQILGFQVAEQMYRGGADVIYPAAGASGDGVFEAASQLSGDLRRQLWAVGVDGDEYRSLAPGDPWRPHVLTSMVKRYDRATDALIDEYSVGHFTPGTREFDLANGGLDLAASGGFIDDLRPRLERLRRQIIAGKIQVPSIPAEKVDAAKALGLPGPYLNRGA
jgi:basic membrane lipoprotein Med (substrate-binding protein (PBP1-ABC) superfamily)/DNA-binding SARP family transcriptional activator